VTLTVLSLGAGVQSTTLALMAAQGEITPMPDCAIFADTQWEPGAVYAHLERLVPLLPFPVHRVSAGDLRGAIVEEGYAPVPWFLQFPDGERTIGRRQCTYQFKLRPLRRKLVELMDGKRPAGGIELWLGISTDEVYRVRASGVQYIVNRYPLIERRLNRSDCKAWLERNGFALPPKSACVGCPFRSNEAWASVTPAEFADAVAIDRLIRERSSSGSQFMHRSYRPLAEVDLAARDQADLFGNECEGLCGT
jgi:hypothetical protein